ncbi:MAG: hypothetical protein ACOX3U_04025 [Christensenellales bacterium]|jgi:hypothetical protein
MPKHNLRAVEESIKNINLILSQIKELLMLVDDEDFEARLKRIYDMIEYANPTSDENIISMERRISNHLGDLKIMLVSRQERRSVNLKMNTIYRHITERNSRT